MTNKYFNRIFFTLSLLSFIVIVIRAITVPFCHDETATFFYYIQGGDFLPYISHVDANNHFLNSFLGWISFRLFGDSTLSLRLPNLLALLVLIIAVYRLSGRLTQTSSKIILLAGLLLSFHWLSFFNVCRGYGISMALLALAFSYVPAYIENKKMQDVRIIYILLNLALSANLTLIITVLLITVLICLFQLYQRCFFRKDNLIMLFIHIIIMLFWIRYSFFLQHQNLLYAGQGYSYWNVTFVSLIQTIVGKQNLWINASVVLAYAITMLVFIYFILKNGKQSFSDQSLFKLFLFILFNGLIIGFFLLKKLFGINFPEDRAGLFFYLLFILNIAFILDELNPFLSKIIATVTLLVFAVHFAWSINFRKHCIDLYEVMPERFYDRLLSEQKQSPQKITVGGHPFRELFYAFYNYKHKGILNPMDDPYTMLMNSDYYVSFKSERKDYAPYYQEIDSEEDYGFTLLKRKQPMVRKPVFTITGHDMDIKKENEYSNLFDIKDSNFTSHNPLLVEINFKILDGKMPSHIWIVLNLDSAEGKALYYRHIPLNWVKYNWLNSENADLILETGPLPARTHRLICYLWNLQHERLKMSINTIKVFQLEGFGVDVGVPNMGKLRPN